MLFFLCCALAEPLIVSKSNVEKGCVHLGGKISGNQSGSARPEMVDGEGGVETVMPISLQSPLLLLSEMNISTAGVIRH